MERLTFLNGDDVPCVTDDNCMEEQSGHYCGPAIDRFAAYEDTGLTPAEVLSMYGEWNAMMSVLNSIGGYERLRELAEADKEGRMVVLPCKVGGSMLDMSYPEKPSIMKRLHFAVAYENIDGVVYHQPWGIFTENIKAGYIKPNCGANLDGEAHGEE